MCSASTEYVFPGMTDEDSWECRSIAQSQVHLLDDIVGEIVDRLKVNGLWENTLLIFQSDNVCREKSIEIRTNYRSDFL